MKKILKFFIALLLMLSVFALPVSAQTAGEAEEGSIKINVEYDSPTVKQKRSWLFEYNDNWFCHDAREYNHKLAQMSLGLALASFRPSYDKETYETAHDHLTDLYAKAGFTAVRSDDYDKNPSLYTVSTGIAHKVITDENGEPFTVIAIGVCGSGYGNEWMSNCTMGESDEHAGFASAAQEVYDRIFGYIAANNLTGHLKAWISGFSRAAAVSNIVAKMLDDSLTFEDEDVFAYTFATPRTTVDPKKGSYTNIFNITGKMDPVPMVPFADWGYDRYGTTLYVISQETDSNFNVLFPKAAANFKQLLGIDMWNNVEWDTRLRVFFNYMLKICPDRKSYCKYIQEHLVSIMSDRSIPNVMTHLMDMASNKEFITEANEKEANALLSYLATSFYSFASSSGIDAKYRSKEASLMSNLALEHVYDTYLAWMFSSDDPGLIFSDELEYLRILIVGKADVAVLSQDEYNEHLIEGINADGSAMQSITTIIDGTYELESNGPDVFLERNGKETVILLPKDMDYHVMVKAVDNQKIDVYAIQLKVGYTDANNSYLLSKNMTADQVVHIYSHNNIDEESSGVFSFSTGETDDDVRLVTRTDQEWAINIQRINVLNLSWRQMVVLSYCTPILVLTLIALLIAWAIGSRRTRTKIRLGFLPQGSKFIKAPSFCVLSIIAVYLIQELFFWLMPTYLSYRSTLKLLIAVLLVYLAFSGWRRQKTELSKLITIAMVILSCADITINYNFGMGMGIYGIAEILMIIAFFRYAKPEKWQYVLWAVSSLVSIAVISYFGRTIFNNLIYSMAVYSIVLNGLLAISLAMPKKIRFASIMLFVANMMLFFNEVGSISLLSHIVSLGTYYLAAISYALSTRFKEPGMKAVQPEQ